VQTFLQHGHAANITTHQLCVESNKAKVKLTFWLDDALRLPILISFVHFPKTTGHQPFRKHPSAS